MIALRKAFKSGKKEKNGSIWTIYFFMGAERGDCTYETIQHFDKLPYTNKVIFTHIEYPEIKSAYYIKGFDEEPQLGNLLEFKSQFLKRRYLDDFDYVSFFNSAI